MGGFMSGLIFGKPPQPVTGIVERVKNIVRVHFRGVFGVLLTIVLLSWQLDFHNSPSTSMHIWIWMFIFYLFQPVTIQVTSLIPIFALPMLGIQETKDCVKHYWNEGTSLFIIGGMLNLLMNNSGLDRRISLYILNKGGFTSFALLFRSSLAAFVMSALSHRLIVASTLIQYVTPVLMDLQAATTRYRDTEPDYDKLRYVINNGIQTSCSIGGTVIVHACYCTLAFRAIFTACVPAGKEYPDVLNYLQYTAFALPLGLVLFTVNFIYHAILLKITAGKPIHASYQAQIGNALKKHRDSIPAKITNHEKWTLLFAILSFVFLFGRWNEWTKSGWAGFSVSSDETIPKVKDATTAAAFVILLHILPRSFGFIKILTAKKKSELPPLKPESAIMFWRFVDKNTNYGYFFLIGAGISLWAAANTAWVSGTGKRHGADIIREQFSFLTNMSFEIAVLLIVMISIVLCNMISGMAALAVWLPLVLCLGFGEKAVVGTAPPGGEGDEATTTPAPVAVDTDSPWVKTSYIPALGVATACSMGFMSPFLYTPAYFCHHTGKVPKWQMAKRSLVACLLAGLVIWAGVAFYAPAIFADKLVYGNAPTSAIPYGRTTTLAPTTTTE